MTTQTLPNTGRHADRRGTKPTVAAGSMPRTRAVVLVRVGRLLGRVALMCIMAVALAAFLFLAVGPRVFGYQTSTMLTGSMAPLINPGDVVVSVPTPVADLKTGDIITYHIPVEDQRVETHRITTVNRAGANTTIQTKGDANNGADPWTATLPGDHAYTTVAVISHLGEAIRALRSPIVGAALLYGAPTLLVLLLLTSIWSRPKEHPTTPAPAAKTSASIPS